MIKSPFQNHENQDDGQGYFIISKEEFYILT